jgi:23S rRNA pseudouridine2605 synthase
MSERQNDPGRRPPGGKRGPDKRGSGKGGKAEAPRMRDPAGSEPSGRPSERIAKRLARAGISSRRDAEALVEAGRVTVNGKVLSSPAFNVGPDDRIAIDGTAIPAIERTRLFLFHKPAGVVTTNRDPQGRRTVFDALPEGLPRLMTVGRLDINTEGLLLLTNDGGLARVLELPSTGWLRRYRVRVHGEVDETALAGLQDGIAVNGIFYGTVEAALDRKQGSNAWLTIGLREGKNREVKNILGALGLNVARLIRISYGPFQLGELAEGEVRELRGRALRDQLGERLIEEAGANFDAPVTTPFSRSQPEPQPEKQETVRSARPTRGPRIEEGGLIRNRKRQREEKREEALGRLTTRASRRPEKDEKKESGTRRRSANVWMAPGARPEGARKKEESQRASKRAAGRTSVEKEEGKGFSVRKAHKSGQSEKRDERQERSRPPNAGSGQGKSGQKASRPGAKEPAGKPLKGGWKRKRSDSRPEDTASRGRNDGRKGRPGADRRR